MEIEINFRLDRDGRTINPNATTTTSNDDTTEIEQEEQEENEQGDIVDKYQSKVVMTNLSTPYDEVRRHWLDELLFDCEITDTGLLPRTFWMPAKGMKPRCTLEQFALDIFHHHVSSSSSSLNNNTNTNDNFKNYDPETSGAEWWAQLRPSPEGTGRYSMHDDNPDEISKTGISFHWDKDEDLRLLMGGTTYIHPHISTVTYLTDYGSPTLAINCRVNNLSGEYIVPGETNQNNDNSTTTATTTTDDDHVEAFISWPKAGKHLSFDGRYLHAALPDMMEPGLFEKQITFPKCEDPKRQKMLKRRHRRVTFLVNIWLNYHPFDVKPFPETMIDKMSGHYKNNKKEEEEDNNNDECDGEDNDDNDNDGPKHLSFFDDNEVHPEATKCRNVIIGYDSVQDTTDNEEYKPEKMKWPMGDCNSNERLEAMIPLKSIRKEAKHGGNIKMKWAKNDNNNKSCFRLYEEKSNQTLMETNCNDDNGDDDSKAGTKRESPEADTTGEEVVEKRPRSDE